MWAGLFVALALSPLQAQLTEYSLPNDAFGGLSGITTGPDGALWFSGQINSTIARITTSGTITAFPLPNPVSYPGEIAAGPDGALWFTESGANKIGRITTAGLVAEYLVPTANSGLKGIIAGSDGALWFTESTANNIGRIATSGSFTEYPLPTAQSAPAAITAGPDGALWFTENARIGRITTSGSITEYPAVAAGITVGPDGAIWFTGANSIGRITTSGSLTEYPLPSVAFISLTLITSGPDGALWFTDVFNNKLGRIDTSGSFSYYIPLPAISTPAGIITGPDGALWFTENGRNKIGRYAPGPPPPTITSLSPNSATGGSPAFTLTVDGTGFTSGSVVNWNGPETGGSQPLLTNYISSTQLTASVSPGLIAKAGTAAVTVVLGGVPSNIALFTINPGPVINSINPAGATAGGPAFSLTVNGSGFASGAVVDWNGSPLSTTYVSSTQVTASVPADLITKAGTAAVTVVLGTLTTDSAIFIINPAPAVSSLGPPSTTAGGPAFTLTVSGSGFASGAVVDWNGAALPTTYMGSTQVTASVPANLITAAGTATVIVISGGVASNDAIFTVNVLAINSLNPPSVPAGGPDFTLTVSGSGFALGSVVNWNGSPLPTTLLNSSEVTAAVPASLIASPGTATITVMLSYGASAPAKLNVTPVLNSQCANIGGPWNWSESGSYTVSISSPVETDSQTYSLSGNGIAAITQTGCSISYNPVPTAGLIGSNLLPSQLASLTRTGAVSGNNVKVTGLLALIDTIGGARAGLTITSVGGDILTAGGQITGNVITLTGTGTVVVSGSYLINGQTGLYTETITATSSAVLTRITGPAITSVAVANGGADIAQNTWIAIKGRSLVPSTTPAAGVIWSTAPEFAQGKMPTQLGGVSVTVNNIPAFVYFYCSAATSAICASDQINVLTPLDSTLGPVSIVVTNNGSPTTAFTATMQSINPAFLQFGTAGYVAGTHADGTLLGPATLYPGASTPARPGEPIVAYGVGFGLPTKSLVNGSSSQSGSLPSLPVCQIGGNAAAVAFAGLISPGLYQLNLTVPSSATSGDNPLSCIYNGSSTPSGALIAVQP